MTEQKNFILLEDNLADAKLFEINLRSIGIDLKLTHFLDGQAFFDFMNDESTLKIDLILIDLNMPGVDGFEVLQFLQSHPICQYIPSAVFSSSTSDADIQKCYALGANAYVAKPLNIDEYADTVAAIASFWGKVNIN